MAKILIVDDDHTLCGMIEEWLKHEKHKVDLAYNAADAWHFMELYEYDAIILDISLPDGSGIDLLNRFRKNGGKTSVLMLTGRTALEHKEEGFDAGADDYLTKPFHIKELILRVRALLKRGPELRDEIQKAGGITLDAKKREVTVHGVKVDFFNQEFDLLEYLMQNPNQVVRTEALISRVWQSDEGVSPEMVRSLIARVRKKIGKDSIDTIYGVGYKLLVDES